MIYQLARNGARLGTYAEDKLAEALASGELQPADLAWCEGMADWRPLADIVASKAGVAAAPGLPPPMPVPPPMPFIGTSGMATASLVCGIISVCGGFITGLPAIIFGVLALNRINKSGGRIGGKGQAITGIALGGVLMIFGTAVLAGLMVPAFHGAQEKARQVEAAKNAREIIIAMKSYAGDHGGAYLDAGPSGPKTANEYFRLLIKGGYVTDERIFTAPGHPEQADGNIGKPPDFKHALEPGENHWSVVVGVGDSASGSLPLIFECANDDAWPPTWNADVAGQAKRGSSWKGGKVVVGRNDGSVSTERLEAAKGSRVTSRLFDPAKPMKYLQPE